MTAIKRWFCLTLSAALALSLALPVQAADPLAESFASFLIDADSADFPELSLHVELYRRDGAGAFREDDSVRYACQVNRAAGEASFFIQPKADGVWAEVDYLTDLNGDGVYEMLDGGKDAPMGDSMTASGSLVPWDGAARPLTNGQTYVLTAQALRERAQAALQARNTPGSGQTLPHTAASLPGVDSVLYLVSLHYLSPVDGEQYDLAYYLRLFQSVIVPSDVPAGAWYYGAVEYALEQGIFSGTGADAFSPAAPMTRAMLWTVLANVNGAALAPGAQWYTGAQSWAMDAGVSDGTAPNGTVTREQLALMLFNLAQPENGGDPAALAAFSDGGGVSPWAAQAVAWALEQGVLSGKGNGVLDPQGSATRAEVAAMLRQYTQLSAS